MSLKYYKGSYMIIYHILRVTCHLKIDKLRIWSAKMWEDDPSYLNFKYDDYFCEGDKIGKSKLHFS